MSGILKLQDFKSAGLYLTKFQGKKAPQRCCPLSQKNTGAKSSILTMVCPREGGNILY